MSNWVLGRFWSCHRTHNLCFTISHLFTGELGDEEVSLNCCWGSDSAWCLALRLCGPKEQRTEQRDHFMKKGSIHQEDDPTWSQTIFRMRNYAKPVLVAGPSRRLCLQFLCPRSSCDWLFPSFSSQLKCPLLSEGFLKASHHPAPLHPTTQFAQLHCPIVLSTSETILFSDDSICPVFSTADSPCLEQCPARSTCSENCLFPCHVLTCFLHALILGYWDNDERETWAEGDYNMRAKWMCPMVH